VRAVAKVAAVSPIRLEPFADEHVAHLDSLAADEDVLRFTRIPVPAPRDFGARWVERYRQGRIDGTSAAFALVDDDGAFLGAVMAPTIDACGCSGSGRSSRARSGSSC
jgi:hypothetical protein